MVSSMVLATCEPVDYWFLAAAQAERFASGLPSERFRKVATKEIKHKLWGSARVRIDFGLYITEPDVDVSLSSLRKAGRFNSTEDNLLPTLASDPWIWPINTVSTAEPHSRIIINKQMIRAHACVQTRPSMTPRHHQNKTLMTGVTIRCNVIHKAFIVLQPFINPHTLTTKHWISNSKQFATLSRKATH